MELFYKLFLIDVGQQRTRQLCPFVKSGIMHRSFHKYLRPDGLGLDYSNLIDYDTNTVIDKFLESQHPYWIERLNKAMSKKDRPALLEAINNAVRIGLDKKNPSLVQRAKDVMNSKE